MPYTGLTTPVVCIMMPILQKNEPQQQGPLRKWYAIEYAHGIVVFQGWF